MPELGLFPLSIVLVPTERIPLHIFEPRYRELIEECVDDETEFGFVLATGDGAVHEIGTRASVLEVLEVLEDGRMNIVVEGGERFRLLELTSGAPSRPGSSSRCSTKTIRPQPPMSSGRSEVFSELAETSESDVDVPEADTHQLDFQLAARVDFGVDAKQELLATTSPRRRMERLGVVFESALEAVRLELDDARAREP